MSHQTYETGQPWCVYTYLMTDAEADARGSTDIQMQCCICGEKEIATIVVPKAGLEPSYPPGYKHPLRIAFLEKHEHRYQQRAPETWKLPLLNPAALSGGDMMDIFRDVDPNPIIGPRGDLEAVRAELWRCANAWEPSVRLLGNIRADEIAALARDYGERCREADGLRARVAGLEHAARSAIRAIDRVRHQTDCGAHWGAACDCSHVEAVRELRALLSTSEKQMEDAG